MLMKSTDVSTPFCVVACHSACCLGSPVGEGLRCIMKAAGAETASGSASLSGLPRSSSLTSERAPLGVECVQRSATPRQQANAFALLTKGNGDFPRVGEAEHAADCAQRYGSVPWP